MGRRVVDTEVDVTTSDGGGVPTIHIIRHCAVSTYIYIQSPRNALRIQNELPKELVMSETKVKAISRAHCQCERRRVIYVSRIL